MKVGRYEGTFTLRTFIRITLTKRRSVLRIFSFGRGTLQDM